MSASNGMGAGFGVLRGFRLIVGMTLNRHFQVSGSWFLVGTLSSAICSAIDLGSYDWSGIEMGL